jgi:hypothetical protein
MPDIDPLKLVTDARDILADPAHWTQGCFARNEAGHPGLAPNDPNAVCYCSFGALMSLTEYNTPPVVYDTMGAVATELLAKRGIEIPDGRNRIVYLNDFPTTTHADVLEMFDITISRLKEAPTS